MNDKEKIRMLENDNRELANKVGAKNKTIKILQKQLEDAKKEIRKVKDDNHFLREAYQKMKGD